MTWLLTGGAGYIGAHVVAALRAASFPVVVLDDLSTGMPERLPADVPFIHASILDRDRVLTALREHHVQGVVHLAAKKAPIESMRQPLHYYRENVAGFMSLLDAMVEAQVSKIVLSSSCAVYGTADGELVAEDSPTNPESPYGETKLICEWLLRDLARAARMNYVILRYFNVAGAAGAGLGDTGMFNLIPHTFRALTEARPPQICGDDYPTRDGTCVRDYLHVIDLAAAHVAAARRLADDECAEIYNVGRGEGSTVKEVMNAISRATGKHFECVIGDRRPGDPATAVAEAFKIREHLGWDAKFDLDEMVRSAWEASQHAECIHRSRLKDQR